MKRFICFYFFLFGFFLLLPSLYSNTPVINSITLEDEVISPVAAEYISTAIRQSETDGATALVINLDTPGGLLTSTRKIIKDMMSAEVPLIVYVTPKGARAGSAGVFITLAANIAAMAPSTNIGAAHPVSLQGKRSLGDAFKDIIDKVKKEEGKKEPKKAATSPMEDKVLNDTVAWVKGIAVDRGRNVDWAVKAVTESVSISASEAKELGVIDYVADNLEDLLRQVDGANVKLPKGDVVLNTKGVKVVEIPLSLRQKILSALASPNIAYILLMLGFYGLLFEFTHPGIGFPGIAGVIAIIVAFYGLHMLAANYAGVALIVLSIILFIVEVKVVSYGLLTLGGLVSLVMGSLLLFDSPNEFMRVSYGVIFAFALGTFAVVMFLAFVIVRSQGKKVSTGIEGLIGSEGHVLVWHGEKGKIFVHGEIWNATGSSGYKKGDSVQIVQVKGIKLIIK